MNQALKQDLKTLSRVPNDSGVAAFRALFQERAGAQAREVEQRLRNMILMMPETLERVRLQSTAPDMPKSARRLYGYLLTYIYERKDIIPEDGNGLFGFLDDAYLVTAACRRTSRSYEPRLKEWLDAMVRALPAEAARLDRVLDGLLDGKADAYEAALRSP
ncbi:MAG: hypothetical protein PHF00_10505 [Elusimicrobia bacterium]|nr:hypothetical protein [Elusimicrobiota bacterium]